MATLLSVPLRSLVSVSWTSHNLLMFPSLFPLLVLPFLQPVINYCIVENFVHPLCRDDDETERRRPTYMHIPLSISIRIAFSLISHGLLSSMNHESLIFFSPASDLMSGFPSRSWFCKAWGFLRSSRHIREKKESRLGNESLLGSI
jgi:hypothetical protein